MFKPLGKKGKNVLIIILLIVALGLILIIITDFNKKEATSPVVVPDLTATQTAVREKQVLNNQPELNVNNSQDAFRVEVPSNTVVPEKDAKLTEAEKLEIAVPVTVAPVSPNSSSKARTFEVRAQNDLFVPSKVIANVGDIVRINFIAVDKDYDLTFPSYGMKQVALAGQTKILEFQALQEGNFSFYCSACGGPGQGPQGNIIIIP